MKKILLIAVLIAACLSVTAYVACVATPLLGKSVKGSGHIVTKTIDAPDFNGIEASRAVKVVVSDDMSDKIRIEADDNLIDLTVVEVSRGKLVVTLDKKVNSISNADITVTVPANGHIRSLHASSASKIRSEVTLKADKFSIDASSAAGIKAAVEATSCDIGASSSAKIEVTAQTTSCKLEASSAAKIAACVTATECSAGASSAAKITLAGSADTFRADLSSAAKLDAGKFTAVNATIDTSSAAGATIDCSGKLTASASSGSKIRYTGDCQTSLSRSSGGSVSRD